jgi:hypothetical protein
LGKENNVALEKKGREPVKLATIALPLSTVKWVEDIQFARRDASMAATLRFLIEVGRAPAEKFIKHSPLAQSTGDGR